jgi:cell division protein FtsZ
MSDQNINTSIKIIGVGGCGIDVLNRIIESGLSGVDFAAFDHDPVALGHSKAPVKLELKSLYSSLVFPDPYSPTRFRASGSPLKEEKELVQIIGTPAAAIIVAGLGGATSSGAIPIIAELAKEAGALTVAVVTRPFGFEGETRRKNAEDAMTALCKESFYCSMFPHSPNQVVMERSSNSRIATLLAIPCDQLFLVQRSEQMNVVKAFNVIDGVLAQAVLHIVNFLEDGFLSGGLTTDGK